MNAIAAERALRGWSQTDLANKMQKDRSTIARWEADPSSMGIPSLCKLSKLFNCYNDYILGLSDERVPRSKVVA